MLAYRWTLCLVAVLVLAGCDKNQTTDFGTIKVDPRISYNAARTPPEWPDEKRDWDEDPRIAEMQQRVYDTMGAPDYFYLFWRRDGKPITTREFETASWFYRDDEKNNPYTKKPEMGWVYLADDIMYTFNRREAEYKPLPDTVKTICDYGDPHEIKESKDQAGAQIEIYQYYDTGKVFYFRDGKLYDEQNLPRMEGFWQRR